MHLFHRAHAKIVNIDLSIAEKCPGFVQFFSAKDVKGSNHIGAIAKDEEVFAVDTVTYFGAVLLMNFNLFLGCLRLFIYVLSYLGDRISSCQYSRASCVCRPQGGN